MNSNEPSNAKITRKQLTIIRIISILILLFIFYLYFQSIVDGIFSQSILRVDMSNIKPECHKLYNGNASDEEVQFAKNWTYPYSEYLTDFHLSQEIKKDCGKFLAKKRYITTTMDRSEKHFGIAFTIITYTNAMQVEQLLRAVYRPWNYYCIHVDLKAPKDFFNAIEQITKCLNGTFGNVVNTKNRVNVTWGEMSVLTADLNCMKELYNRYKTWKYLINLTGQEYPLKTNRELVQIFKAYNGANNVMGFFKERFLSRMVTKKLYFPLIIYQGSVHITVNRHFIKFIFESQKAKVILNALEHNEFQDEQYFSTLNFNSQLKIPGSFIGDIEDMAPFGNRLYYFLARYKFDEGYECLSDTFYSGLCMWGVRDMPNLITAKHLVANKFIGEPAALYCLEKWYYEKVKKESLTLKSTIDSEYYKSLIFVTNQYRPKA